MPPALDIPGHQTSGSPADGVDPQVVSAMVRPVAVRAIPAVGQGGAMRVEDNKQAVRRVYQEGINGRTLDALEELLTPMGSTTPSAARAPSRPSCSSAWSTRPSDLHAEVHEVIAEGELVAARVTYTGTHQGEFLGIPATGRKTTTSGGRLLPDAGRPAGRALGWAGHVQLPDAAGRHARTGHAGTSTPAYRSRGGH